MKTRIFVAAFAVLVMALSSCSQIESGATQSPPASSSEAGESIQAEPTDTALPTAEPTLTATIRPTATIDSDPTVYDNFENPANNGSFNADQWRLSGNAPNPTVQQQDGVVMFSAEEGNQYSATVLVAREYDGFQIDSPMFFEADLMLSPNSGPGEVNLTLYTIDISPEWFSKCYIRYLDNHGANCMHAAWDEGISGDQEAFFRTITPGDWHSFRIEVDPETMHFEYYIDGVISGQGVPVDAERLRGAEFQVVIGISKLTDDQPVVGFVDNVRIGPLTR